MLYSYFQLELHRLGLTVDLQDIIKQCQILCLLLMCTTDGSISIVVNIHMYTTSHQGV